MCFAAIYAVLSQNMFSIKIEPKNTYGKKNFIYKMCSSPWVVASVDGGEGAESHIIRALAVLRRAVKIPI